MKAKMLITCILFITIFLGTVLINTVYCQDDDQTRNVLKQGLLGAGVGAISSGASGGNAGQGALIGAGTNVIGGALLDAVTTPSAPRRTAQRRVAAPPPQDEYYDDNGDDAEYYEEAPPQESGTSKVLKQGLVGAGSGALAAGMSGGNAGKGALIGAGTNVIGSALLDAITQPAPQPRRVIRKAPRRQAPPPPQAVQAQPVQAQNVQVQEEPAGTEGGRKRVIKKYDQSGKLVSEEEVYY